MPHGHRCVLIAAALVLFGASVDVRPAQADESASSSGAVIMRSPVRSCAPTSQWRTGRRCYPRRFNLEFEIGPTWQTKNEVAVPGNTGTRFDLTELTGSGPFLWGRMTFDWQVWRRHAIRLVLAPFEISGTGTLSQPVSFQNQAFAAGVPTKATYRFNSYRLTYRYTLLCNRRWTLRVGATAKIRDAKIELEQAGQVATDTDLGFVPLLHLAAEYRIAPRWRITADLDGAAASQGRAFDFSLKLNYDLSRSTYLAVGYRTLEGGADVDAVYTFAWLHQALVAIGFRF